MTNEITDLTPATELSSKISRQNAVNDIAPLEHDQLRAKIIKELAESTIKHMAVPTEKLADGSTDFTYKTVSGTTLTSNSKGLEEFINSKECTYYLDEYIKNKPVADAQNGRGKMTFEEWPGYGETHMIAQTVQGKLDKFFAAAEAASGRGLVGEAFHNSKNSLGGSQSFNLSDSFAEIINSNIDKNTQLKLNAPEAIAQLAR